MEDWEIALNDLREELLHEIQQLRADLEHELTMHERRMDNMED